MRSVQGEPECRYRADSVDLPEGWAWATVGDVTAPKLDKGGPRGAGDFLYIDISSIDNHTKVIVEPKVLPIDEAPSRARQRLEPLDVLVSMTRPNLNAVALVPQAMEGAIGSTGFHVLRAVCVEPQWLFYLVQTSDFIDAMSFLVQGALYPAVRPADVAGYEIPLAPLPEQRRIVAEIEKQFTRLDAAVAALERARANLKRYRASVLAAACEGRLVPTEAELARREGRDYEPAAALLDRILAERRARWEADEFAKMHARGKPPQNDAWKSKYKPLATPDTVDLPDLLEGWVWATVEQLSSGVDYGSSSKTSEESDGVPVLRMGNIVDGHIDATDLKYLPADHDEFPRLLLESGEILFNRTNSAELVGKTAVYRGNPRLCSFASYLIRVRPSSLLIPELLAYYINSVHGRSWIQSVVSQQVGQANVNGTKLKALRIPLPPLAEQQRIVAEVERRLSVVEEMERAVEADIQRAGRLRQAILKRAFEGRLVPQDPDDEPASSLLERIHAERELASRRGQRALSLATHDKE